MKLTLFLLTSITFLSSNTYSRVLNNKGPIFLKQRDKRFSQHLVYPMYALFQTIAKIPNYVRAISKSQRANKITEEQFHLFRTERDLTSNRFSNRIQREHYYGYHYYDGDQWKFLNITIGLCVGYTMTLRKFHYLAFFDGNQPAPYDYETNPKEYMNFYKKILDDIMINKPRVIPGFSNLREFSLSPLKRYLQQHIVDQWVINNLTLQGKRTYFVTGRMTEKKIEKLYQKLRWFLDRNFHPRVYFTAGFMGNAHSVRVVDAEMDGQNLKFRYLNTDGGIYNGTSYPGSTMIRLMDFEKAHFVDMATNLSKFCNENSSYCR